MIQKVIVFCMLTIIVIAVLSACATGQPIPLTPQEPDERQGSANQPSIPVQTPAQTASRVPEGLVGPEHFIYKGAFRLPDDADRPLAFAYGGEAVRMGSKKSLRCSRLRLRGRSNYPQPGR